MTQPIVVLGAGGVARQIRSLVRDINTAEARYEIIGFLAPEDPQTTKPLPILGTDKRLRQIDARYVLGIGIPHVRARLDEFATGLGRDTVTLINPHSNLEMDTDLGPGCLILPGARLQTGTSLGRHVFVNANAVVGHDCDIADHVVLSPLSMLAGGVRIGARVLIGAGAVVLPERKVGEDAVIGAGAVVTTDIPPGACAMGVPARAVEPRPQGKLDSSPAPHPRYREHDSDKP